MKKFLLNVYIKLCLIWVVIALTFQVTMVVLQFANPKIADSVAKELTWKIDGTFKK